MVNPLYLDESVQRRYRPERRVGRGCYGIVWLVTRKSDGQQFVVKRIYNAFQNPTDSQRTYREVLILLNLRGFSGVVTLFDVVQSSNDKELYLVLDFVDTDLHSTLRNTSLQQVHQQYIIQQIFRALKFVHSANVVYRDLKPSNILLNTRCELKLCDFGFARILGEEDTDSNLTDYVSCRWYRAPELLLRSRQYRFSIDMWAAGCIVAEIYTTRTLFVATSTLHLLDLILVFCGKPSPRDIVAMQSPYAETMLGTFPQTSPADISKKFRNANNEALDILRLLLQFNPAKRLTAEEALEHPYVASFHNPDDEPTLGRKINLTLPCAEHFLSSAYRDEIYAEVLEIPRARRRLRLPTLEEKNAE